MGVDESELEKPQIHGGSLELKDEEEDEAQP